MAARYAPDTASSSVYTGAEGWNAVKVYALTTPTVALTSTATAGTISYKDSITFTATVTASGAKPTGKVNFLDGTAQIGSGNLNSGGVGTYSTTTLIAGKHSITASYAGDTNYTPATSNAVSITVKQYRSLGQLGGSGGNHLWDSAGLGATRRHCLRARQVCLHSGSRLCSWCGFAETDG